MRRRPAPQCHRVPITPSDIPNLAAFWDFQDEPGPRRTRAGAARILREHGGPIARARATANPWGPYAARLREGQYFVCPRAACPELDVHGPGAGVTVVAWVRRGRAKTPHCEFIAGQWNETARGRQYGLFIDIAVWERRNRVSAHVSHTGGPTPGYRYCIDVATSATPVPVHRWTCVAMTYDGAQAAAWKNGRLEAEPGLNPYPMPGGLHDGGPNGSDFTVGAVDRSGEMGNFFVGLMGGLAVYRRALSPAEMLALADPALEGTGG